MSRRRLAGALAALALLAGCATVPGPEGKPVIDPRDPFEPWNRGVYAFNEGLDRVLLRPVATAYRKVTPEPVRQGVDNFFGNLGDLWSAFNLALQGKPRPALEMGMRVGTNTVFGLGGLLDPASEMGLERQTEDFGQTLGSWGIAPGPFVMIPVLGPSTLRDSLALTVDTYANPARVFGEPRDRNSAAALEVVAERARLLSATRTLDTIALDKYILLRDATFARRRNLVYDGDPPEEETPPAQK